MAGSLSLRVDWPLVGGVAAGGGGSSLPPTFTPWGTGGQEDTDSGVYSLLNAPRPLPPPPPAPLDSAFRASRYRDSLYAQ